MLSLGFLAILTVTQSEMERIYYIYILYMYYYNITIYCDKIRSSLIRFYLKRYP